MPMSDLHTPETETVRVHQLSLTLGGKQLLHDLSFQTHTSGTTMIMGPNGAGKSLLLRCLHGLLTPDRGTVTFFGQPAHTQRHHQAMVFQKAVLLRRTARANLLFACQGSDAKTRRIATLLADVHLTEKADQPARLLSGGEQQRLALARALLTEPQILFLDEPTASLDPASVLIIERLIQEANGRGVKTLFISHDLGQAKRLASDIVFLHKGQITEHSPADTFFTDPQSKEARAYLGGELVF